jgi:hypothetical protein
MLDWLQPTLGFVSASLVALIALSFGALFLFFSGSAALVLGHFLRFARAPRLAAVAIATAALLAGGVALLGGFAPWWAPPLAWIACGLLGYALVRVRTLQVAVQRIGGAFLLASGLLYVVSLSVTTLAPYAVGALALCGSLLAMAAAGLGPLVVAGLVQHYRERRVEWFLSLRYLVAKRRQTFISVITVICVVGVALGVAVITVVLSVMNGFSRVWEEKIVGNRAHFVVHSRLGPYDDYLAVRERVLDVDGVVGATPFLVTEAILRDDSGAIQAVLLKGVEPSTVGQATELERDLVAGSLSNLQPQPGAAGTEAFPGVVIGAELADRFLLRVGDPVILISPLGGQPTPLGPAPRLERFRVAGVFRANFFQFDETFVYTSLAGAQRFMKLDDVATGIEVRTDDPYRSQLVARTVEQTLGEFFFARDWKEFYGAQDRARDDVRAALVHHGRGGLHHRRDADHDDHGEVARHLHPEGHGLRGRRRASRLCDRGLPDRSGRIGARARDGPRDHVESGDDPGRGRAHARLRRAARERVSAREPAVLGGSDADGAGLADRDGARHRRHPVARLAGFTPRSSGGPAL